MRDVIRAHRKIGFDAIFNAGVSMLRTRAAKSRYLKEHTASKTSCSKSVLGGATSRAETRRSTPSPAGAPGAPGLGFFGVLHTWGRDLQQFHPHVHFVVPGGAVTENAKEPTATTGREQRPTSHDDPRHRPPARPGWLATPTNFLFHHGTMCREYRDFFKQIMEAAELLDDIPADVWTKKWVVDVKPVGDGKAVLKYLAPYVYRVAISNNRIVACDERSVTYRVYPSKGKPYTRTVSGERFVQSFAQHILPKQYSKIRHYGWMSSNSRFKLDSVRWLVWLWLGWTYWLGSGMTPPEKPERELLRCEHCGGTLTLKMITGPDGRVVWPGQGKWFDTS